MQWKKLFFVVLMLGVPAFACAQDVPGKQVDPTVLELLLSVTGALVVAATTFGVGLIKKHVLDVPRWAVPVLSAGIGVLIDYLMSFKAGGQFAPVVTVLLVGVVNLLRSVLTNLPAPGVIANKTILVLLIGVGLVSQGCASTAGPKKDALLALTAVRSALDITEQTLLKTECGKPVAPPEGMCVPKAAADKAYGIIRDAAASGEKARAFARSLPPALDGSITSPQLTTMISELWDLVKQVVGLFPPSNVATKLQGDVKSLEAKK